MGEITRDMYAALKSAVMAEIRESMKVYGISHTDAYLYQQDFASLQELVDWRITMKVYGGELHPGAKVRIA